MFSKDNTQKNTTIDQIMNEFEPYKGGEVKDKNGLKLKGFTVNDDGETLIQLNYSKILPSLLLKNVTILSRM